MAETSQEQSRKGFENFGRRMDEQFGSIGPKMEEEVRRVIAYLNDRVVPQVRRESSTALRAAAEQLRRLAEQLEQQAPANPPAQNPDAGSNA